MKSLLTMELGALEVKLAQSEDGCLTRQVAGFLPEGAFQDGVATETFTAFLKHLLIEGGMTARMVRVAMPDSGIAVRDFRLPVLPTAELADAVMYEGKRLIPIDPATVYYAWHARRVATQFAIYLVAARRDMVDALGGALQAAGLQVDRMDLKIMALARGAGAADGLLLEWGTVEGTVALMLDARPRFFRSFLLESQDAQGQFEELAAALDALVRFMRSAEPDLALAANTPLYLCGRFATEVGADERAHQRFPFDARWPSPPVRWAPDFPWQDHLTGVGLIANWNWERRLTPAAGGDTHAAA